MNRGNGIRAACGAVVVAVALALAGCGAPTGGPTTAPAPASTTTEPPTSTSTTTTPTPTYTGPQPLTPADCAGLELLGPVDDLSPETAGSLEVITADADDAGAALACSFDLGLERGAITALTGNRVACPPMDARSLGGDAYASGTDDVFTLTVCTSAGYVDVTADLLAYPNENTAIEALQPVAEAYFANLAEVEGFARAVVALGS